MSIDPQMFYSALLDAGIRDFSGVPCSILDPLIVRAEESDEIRYLRASVEGEAVAVACGAWLAGSLGAVLLQNSGLGNAINPLASLALPYRIPLLLIVSWRGEPGTRDAAQHGPMGRATPGLLDLFDIPATPLRDPTQIESAVEAAALHMRRERRPAALLVPRGLFAKEPRQVRDAEASRWANAPPTPKAEAVTRFGGGALPSRAEVISAFLQRCGEAATVSTTGYMSRELAARAAPGRHFPMQGSMGFALSIALGISRVQTTRPVFVLDGDGALLMRLGSLATAGAKRPSQLTHLVLDNGTYASTGGQPTISPLVDFAGAALACGYARAATCNGREGLAEAMDWAAGDAERGPGLLHLRIDQRESADLVRPKVTPPEIASDFRTWLIESSP